MNTSSFEFNAVLDKLMKAIVKENKKGILQAYEDAKSFDLDKINDNLFNQYEKLVEKGNTILGV